MRWGIYPTASQYHETLNPYYGFSGTATFGSLCRDVSCSKQGARARDPLQQRFALRRDRDLLLRRGDNDTTIDQRLLVESSISPPTKSDKNSTLPFTPPHPH